MNKFQPLHAVLILFSALSLAACASNPQNTQPNSAPHQLSSGNQSGVITLPQQKDKRLRDRLAGGVIDGAVLAAKGTASVAKTAVVITAEGAGLVAKGAVASAKIGGKAAIGTGEIIVDGTQRTASGVKNGLDFMTKAPATKNAVSPVGNKTFTDAALSPLSDFNIRKRERPEILMRLENEDVYQLDANAGCDWYDVRIEELDDVLGEDYDVQRKDKSTLQKMKKRGHEAALSGVASQVGAAIPGRGMVRALSGASARQKKTRQIYQKGVARRSFLKGVAISEGCVGY